MKKIDYRKLDQSIIWFSAIEGYARDCEFFSEYTIKAPDGIAWKILKKLPREKYGTGVESILFMLYIEGDVDWFKMPKKPSLGPFGKKSKGWNFKIPLSINRQKEITTQKDMEVFIFDNIIELITILKKRKNTPEDFNLDLFVNDCIALTQVCPTERDKRIPLVKK